jgi:cation transport ATPase
MTAVLLPVIMIFGHVLEERSVIGSHEAISALGRLTHSRARLRGPDGAFIEVDNSTLKAETGTLTIGDIATIRPAPTHIPHTIDIYETRGHAQLDRRFVPVGERGGRVVDAESPRRQAAGELQAAQRSPG